MLNGVIGSDTDMFVSHNELPIFVVQRIRFGFAFVGTCLPVRPSLGIFGMPRILVVDDEAIVRKTIQNWLEREGFEVVSTQDGREALSAVETSAIDLVIIDMFMPGIGGLEVIGALRERIPSVPIIAISGYMFGEPMPELIDTAEQDGVAYCLHKPFRPRHLMAAVESCLGISAQLSNNRAAGA